MIATSTASPTCRLGIADTPPNGSHSFCRAASHTPAGCGARCSADCDRRAARSAPPHRDRSRSGSRPGAGERPRAHGAGRQSRGAAAREAPVAGAPERRPAEPDDRGDERKKPRTRRGCRRLQQRAVIQDERVPVPGRAPVQRAVDRRESRIPRKAALDRQTLLERLKRDLDRDGERASRKAPRNWSAESRFRLPRRRSSDVDHEPERWTPRPRSARTTGRQLDRPRPAAARQDAAADRDVEERHHEQRPCSCRIGRTDLDSRARR